MSIINCGSSIAGNINILSKKNNIHLINHLNTGYEIEIDFNKYPLVIARILNGEDCPSFSIELKKHSTMDSIWNNLPSETMKPKIFNPISNKFEPVPNSSRMHAALSEYIKKQNGTYLKIHGK